MPSCPFCHKRIKRGAIKCRWCGSSLESTDQGRRRQGAWRLATLITAPVAAVVILALIFMWIRTQGRLSDAREQVNAERAELASTEQDLSSAREDLTSARGDLTDLREDLASTKDQLQQSRAEFRRLEKTSQGSLEAVEEEAGFLEASLGELRSCMAAVLDAYNLYEYYEDIGIALEDALFSQACGGIGPIPGYG